MRNATKLLAGCLVVAAIAWVAGCNSLIDDPDGPNVVLEVENVTIPPVSSAVDSVTNTCVFTITSGTGTFKNKPKNSLAGEQPFNDIILQGVDIDYLWDDTQPMATVKNGIAGAVPANGSSTAQFYAVTGDALSSATTSRDGHSANLQMTFSGVTVSGDPVSVTTGGMLVVNSCTTAPVGACCLVSGACNISSQATCVGNAGTYQGDNTSCLTAPCN